MSEEKEHQRSSAATEDALGYAQRLATILWEKHYRNDAPEWKPLPDVVGVLTQIDNMTAGLSRDDLLQTLSNAVLETTLETTSNIAAAVENLARHQEQCDMDGVMVKVSRQALDEVLSCVEAINGFACSVSRPQHHTGEK